MKGSESQKRLPPGQKVIPAILRWGSDHPLITSTIPEIDASTWSLVIEGEVHHPMKFSYSQLLERPAVESVIDFHCVEGWSVMDCKWTGVAFQTLVDEANPTEKGKFVHFSCADGYDTSLSLDELLNGSAILAYKLDGEDLPRDLGGPVRLIVKDKYCYKSPMWVTRITFKATKELGYWERKGYSDTADVWKNDRYA